VPASVPPYHRKAAIAGFLFATLVVALAFAIAAAAPRLHHYANHSARAAVSSEGAAVLPLRFEAALAQSGRVRGYIAHGANYTIALDRGSVGIVLARAQRNRSSRARRVRPVANSWARPEIIAMRLLGASPQAALEPSGAPAGRVNYLLGANRSRWRFGVPTYAKIVERAVWPGIDLIYYGAEGRLEFDLAMAPRAHPDEIRIALVGARGAIVDRDGDLVLATDAGKLRLKRPTVYAQSASSRRRRPLAARYVILARDAQVVTIGFRLGPHDANSSVVIDPQMDYSSFLGGSGRDVATAVAADSAGDVYLAGMTASPDFPTTAGALDSSCWYCSNGASAFFASAFVSELRPDAAGAAQLVYSTYLGGTTGWGGGAAAIALDARGYIHLAGVTSSTDFPITAGAFSASCADAEKPFLAILNPAASGAAQLVYATCIGGATAYSGATALALDANGRDYLAGYTADADFPVTPDAFAPSCPGCAAGRTDGFLSVIDSSLWGTSAMIYSTFIGGSGDQNGGDAATGIAIAAPGDAWIAGVTASADFPTTSGAFQTVCPSAADPAGCASGFVAHLLTDKGAGALAYGTYLGGSSSGDGISAIALASSGAPAVTGATFSSDFPVTAGAFQKKCGGGCAHGDGFVALLAPGAAKQIGYASFLGGSGSTAGGDSATAIAAAPDGDLYLAGAALSSDFPVTADAAQKKCPACANTPPAPNAFVSVVRPAASGAASLIYSTYLGGAGGFDGTTAAGDAATAIAFDSASGGMYVAGGAASPDFPISANAFQTTCPGCLDRDGGDAFVAHFTAPPAPVPAPSPSPTPTATPTPDPDTAAMLEYRPGRLVFGAARIGGLARRRTIVLFNPYLVPVVISGISISGGGDFAASNRCGPVLGARRRCAIAVRFAPLAPGPRVATLQILDSARNSPQAIALTGRGVSVMPSRGLLSDYGRP
jgi:hypothetical protein